MRKYESYCVGCPSDMGCLGSACPNVDVPVDYCDNCNEYAEYRIDGDDYCKECAKKYLMEAFGNLTVSEQAELLEIDIERIGNQI